MSDTDPDEELQYPKHPLDQDEKEEGECTDQEDPSDLPPLVDEDNNTYPPDPWNDGAKTLQDNLYFLEPEPNYEEYGVPEGTMQRREILLQVNRMHRCVDEIKRTVQAISKSQNNVQEISKAEVLLKVNNINRSVENILTTLDKIGESQSTVQEILGDLYDIIKDMNRMDDGEPQDSELLQKIKDISLRMNQVNLGQESVKETMMELRDIIEGHPSSRKRAYYQTVTSNRRTRQKR